MKKTYIKPELNEFNIAVQQLMADSLTFDDENRTGSGSLIDEEAQDPGLSRQHNIWDDED